MCSKLTQHDPIKFKRLPKEKGALQGEEYMDLRYIESYFSYIPKGSYATLDGRTVTSESFYMLRFEVPNMLYKLFLNDLGSQGKTSTEIQPFFPDTQAWGYNEPYKEYYFSHNLN